MPTFDFPRKIVGEQMATDGSHDVVDFTLVEPLSFEIASLVKSISSPAWAGVAAAEKGSKFCGNAVLFSDVHDLIRHWCVGVCGCGCVGVVVKVERVEVVEVQVVFEKGVAMRMVD